MGRAVRAIPFLVAALVLSLCLHGCRSVQELNGVYGTRSLLQDDTKKHEVHCSRERSRIAWKIIEEISVTLQYLMPFVEQEQYEISSKCRLHPDTDMFREQEQHKIHVETNEWRCGFCKKSFRAEKFLDQHFDNRHYNLLNYSQGQCLADLCGALHCDRMVESKKSKTKCNPAAAARNHHLCESLADNCFPTNQGHSASRLHEFFLRQFCDAHTCTGGKKPFSRGGKAVGIEFLCNSEVFVIKFCSLKGNNRIDVFVFVFKQSSVLYLAVCILIVMLLPLFYLMVYLHQRYRNEETHPRLETHPKNRAEDKTFIDGETKVSGGQLVCAAITTIKINIVKRKDEANQPVESYGVTPEFGW
ncbi:zinc finger protein [Musa troglodytarum]|uniref:Zinc finger protein n=1 Tax=Musa troglodytarum TaxID=320322 RepID=A0A9E7JD77_9LILI|nr:zinc finger protein [Musa troglodytarum]